MKALINRLYLEFASHKFKDKFKNDPIGSFLFIFTVIFISVTLLTLPIFTYHEGYTKITNLLSIVSCALIVIFLLFRGEIHINYYVLFLLAFVLFAFIITIFTTREFTYMKTLITTHAFAILVFLFFANFKNYKYFFVLMLFSFFIYAFAFLIEYLPDIIRSGNYFDRLGEVLGNVNGVGFTFNTACVFLFSLIYAKRGKYFLLLIPALIFVLCILLTGSRGAYFSAAIIFVVFFYLLIGEKHKFAFFTSAIAIVGSFFLVIQLPIFASFRDRFYSMFASIFSLGNAKGSDGSSITRINMFIDGLKLWLKNIFFGYGIGGFKANTSYPYYSHNTISEVLADTGIIGGVLFAIPFFISLKLKKSIAEKNMHGYTVLLTSLTIVALFFDIIFYTKISILSWCVFAVYVYSKTSHNQKELSLSFNENRHFKFSFLYHKGEPLEKPVREIPFTEPNIAFVITTLSGGGAERVSSLLCSEWSKKYKVTLILTSVESGAPSYSIDKNVEVYKISAHTKINALRKIKKIRRILISKRSNICVSFIPSSFMLSKIAGIGLNIKNVFSVRNDPSHSYSHRILQKFAYKFSTCIVCQTLEIDNYFNKRKYTKSLVIRNPLSNDLKFISDNNKNLIIAIGRLEPQKRFDFLIKSFKEAHDNNNSLKLTIFGSGSQKQYLESLIDELNLNSFVLIHDFTDSIKEEICKYGIYCCSSYFEGMSNSMLECAACGLPVVTTDCAGGCASKIVINNKNGIIVDRDSSVSEYAKAILEVCNNYTLFYKNSIITSNEINKEYKLETVSKEWTDLFIYILN